MVSIDEAFDGTSRLFSRADQHVKSIRDALEAFSKARPYVRVVDFDPNRGDYAHKIKLIEEPEEDIGLLVFEASNALRSSLDHAIFASTRVLLGREPTRPELLEFPFGRDEEGARSKLRSGNETDPKIFELAMSFKPYEGGDSLLMGLNKLRNIKNHRTLLEFAIALGSMTLSGGHFVSTGPHPALSLGQSEWDRSKKELTLFRAGEAKSDYDLDVAVKVVFNDASPFPGRDVYEQMCDLLRTVRRILVAIDDETERLIGSR